MKLKDWLSPFVSNVNVVVQIPRGYYPPLYMSSSTRSLLLMANETVLDAPIKQIANYNDELTITLEIPQMEEEEKHEDSNEEEKNS